jgi:dsDNA-specific endonuclease/ATPase MutS2
VTQSDERSTVTGCRSAGAGKAGGIVLGSGAGVQYVEPASAVALNNELAAARAEALAAEEAVLASLTQAAAERSASLQALLQAVARLDCARARSRCAAPCL